MARAVELRIAGQNFRVVSSAPAEELERLAALVNRRLADIPVQGRGTGAQGILLVALALEHELEEERARRADLERRTREWLTRVSRRLDDWLADAGDDEASSARESFT